MISSMTWGVKFLRPRGRPQLGLQPGLPDGAALTAPGAAASRFVNYRHAFHAGNFADDELKHVILDGDPRRSQGSSRRRSGRSRNPACSGLGLYDLQADEAERTQEWRGGVDRLGEPFAARSRRYRALSGDPRDGAGAPRRRLSGLAADHARAHAAAGPGGVRRAPPRGRGGPGAALPARRAGQGAPSLRLGRCTPSSGKGAARARPRRSALRGAGRARAPRPRCKGAWQMADRHLRRLVSDQGSARRRRPGRDHRRRRARQGPAPRADDRPATAPDRLNGCGLFVANPPWRLAAEAETILPALAERLARGRYGGFRWRRRRRETRHRFERRRGDKAPPPQGGNHARPALVRSFAFRPQGPHRRRHHRPCRPHRGRRRRDADAGARPPRAEPARQDPDARARDGDTLYNSRVILEYLDVLGGGALSRRARAGLRPCACRRSPTA